MQSSIIASLALIVSLSLNLGWTSVTDASVVERLDGEAEGIIRRLYAGQTKVVAGVEGVVNGVTKVRSKGASCQCVDYDCGCCAHLFFPKIKLDDSCCVNVSYLPKEYGIAVLLTIDTLVLVNITVSARNPPPICFGIPYLEKEASVCLRFYDIDWSNKTLSGCLRLEARLLHIVVESVNFGCFHFPLPGGRKGLGAGHEVAGLVAALRGNSGRGSY